MLVVLVLTEAHNGLNSGQQLLANTRTCGPLTLVLRSEHIAVASNQSNAAEWQSVNKLAAPLVWTIISCIVISVAAFAGSEKVFVNVWKWMREVLQSNVLILNFKVTSDYL